MEPVGGPDFLNLLKLLEAWAGDRWDLLQRAEIKHGAGIYDVVDNYGDRERSGRGSGLGYDRTVNSKAMLQSGATEDVRGLRAATNHFPDPAGVNAVDLLTLLSGILAHSARQAAPQSHRQEMM